ncbi:hypothetical protein PoMZ_02816 [Pyricularia oryzae]|uniref:Uncharacterized protein n=1 Tax=Pyricularia oryzae TaxID=318829 RepID=A0A4P7N5P7_PYROR|nr:hypothetical protein PoMZ_02816 [Pyricularia oryzae]
MQFLNILQLLSLAILSGQGLALPTNPSRHLESCPIDTATASDKHRIVARGCGWWSRPKDKSTNPSGEDKPKNPPKKKKLTRLERLDQGRYEQRQDIDSRQRTFEKLRQQLIDSEVQYRGP